MISPRCQPVPTPSVSAGWTRRELAELDDRELLGIAGSLPRFGQRRMAACELLVVRYRYLVRSCVQRYNRGPEPAEDLLQVGYVGLVAAINNFDPAVGCLRFYGGMTQDKIGQQLGISQIQVSRLLGRALGYLRPRLLGLDEATLR
jgi:DNA-directed RNA polymerase specialized sigma subunit